MRRDAARAGIGRIPPRQPSVGKWRGARTSPDVRSSAPFSSPGACSMGVLLFAVVLTASLFLVVLGLPGLWLMVGAALVYHWLAAPAIGVATLLLVAVIALIAEVLEFTLAARYTKKYGGSPRAGWGAIVGGFVGAMIGIPIPVVGSVVGAFAGAFVGALALEMTRRDATRASATRVAWGALIGRVAAAGAKTGFGCAIMAILLVAAIRG